LFGILRAAGFAAAAIGAASSPAFADPFQALASEAPQGPSAFIDHTIASTDIPAQPEVIPPAVEILESKPKPVGEQAVSTTAPESIAPAEDQRMIQKRSLLSLVDAYSSSQASTAELECLAGAIYFEAKGEPLAGQLAVAEVIINRTRSGRYPTSMCGVVKQRGQFSFIRGGQLPPIPKQSTHWRKAVAIAHIARNDLADSPAENALSFHATYVAPRWRMKRVATVGNHVFYR
jgi:spore germination cell wall hydrolase CwlJ-like protein